MQTYFVADGEAPEVQVQDAGVRAIPAGMLLGRGRPEWRELVLGVSGWARELPGHLCCPPHHTGLPTPPALRQPRLPRSLSLVVPAAARCHAVVCRQAGAADGPAEC